MAIFSGKGRTMASKWPDFQVRTASKILVDEFASKGMVFVQSRQHNARYHELCNLYMDCKQ